MTYAKQGLPPRALTPDEQERLLDITGQRAEDFRDHIIFALAFGLGLRQMEIEGLDCGDVYTPKGYTRSPITLRMSGRRASSVWVSATLCRQSLQAAR